MWTSTDYGWSWPGPDGEWMMTPDAGGLVTVRDPENHEPIGSPLVGHTGVATAFDATESADRVITGSVDGTARVWDVEARVQLGRELQVGTRGLGGVWSPDGTKLAIPRSGNGGLVVWNYDTDTWADIACEVAGRNLTRAEWEEFGPRTIEYRPTCEQYPIEE